MHEPNPGIAALSPGSGKLAAYEAPGPEHRGDFWPAHLGRNRAGQLTLHGTALSEILAQNSAKTPVFLVDMDDFRSRARTFQTEFDRVFAGGAQVHYAAKAFLSLEVARAAADAGLGLDTASEGELTLALASGCEPALIGLHGNAKTEQLLHQAITAQIGRIIVDSLAEVERIQRVLDSLPPAYSVPLMIRLTTGIHAGGHDFIATAHEDQKFGLSIHHEGEMPSPAMQAARRILADERLELVGLHSHIGSQISDLAAFDASTRKTLEFRAELARETGYTVPEIDLGGGYAIAYSGDDSPAPTPRDLATGLEQVVQNVCKELDQPVPFVSIEPGRSLIGSCGITLYRVVNIKDQPLGTQPDGTPLTRRYVSVDGGMSDNIRPALYGATYTAALANRTSDAELTACRLVGSHCESGDIVVKDIALPQDLDEDELLAVPATGAYGWAMSSNYNWFARRGVLGVSAGSAGATASWLIEPETVDAMLAHFDPAYREYLHRESQPLKEK